MTVSPRNTATTLKWLDKSFPNDTHDDVRNSLAPIPPHRRNNQNNGKFSISSRLGCALLATAFLAVADDFTVHAQTLPQILNAKLQGKKLIVTGHDFALGASILIDGRKGKTKNSADNPTGELIAKKGRKRIGQDQIVTLHVVNPAGIASSGFRFFGGPTSPLPTREKQ